MKRGMRKIQALLFLIVIAVTILPVFSTTVSAKEKTIKVAKYDVPGLNNSEIASDYAGFASEYLDEITKYTDWDYEFVDGNWDNLLSMLENGEIDMVCTAQYSVERDEIYDYSDEPLGYENSKLYAGKDDNRFYFDDFTAFDGMTVAALREDLANSKFETYAAENNFSFNFKYYATAAECFEALDAGKVDAVFNAGMKEITGYKTIGDISSDPFYIIVKHGNSQLLSEVNRAMTKIRIANPSFSNDLYENYFGSSDVTTIPSFTREEMEYIASAGTITVGNQVDRFPWCDIDEAGNLYGIQVDLLDMISQLSGLTFTNEAVDKTIRAVDYMNEDTGVRIFNGLSKSEFATFSPDIILTDPMFSDTISFVAIKGSTLYPDDAVSVVIPNAFINGEQLLKKMYPNATVTFAGTKLDCLDALLNGSADFALLDTYMSSSLLQKPRYESLTVLTSTGIRQDIDMAVLKSENPLLLSIINKCLDSIGTNDKTNIITKYTVSSQYQLSFREYLYKYRTWFILITLLLSCLIAGLIAILSLRIRSAAKLERANAELKELNNSLVEATEQAKQANHAKSAFLSQMSHDMRTPMNGILGMAELCNDEDNTAVLHDNINKIKSSGQYLLGLINETLDYQKIESGQLTFTSEIIAARELLDSVNGIIEPMAKKKDISYQVKIEQVAIQKYIKTDPIRIRQIFVNLLSNAIKFTPCGGTVEFTQTLVQRDSEYSKIKYTITDTGCGMSDDFVKNKLFKSFSQEMRTVVPQSEGTGLGLSIVKKLVELMNGEIYVERAIDKGTRFTVILVYPVIDENAVDIVKSDNSLKLDTTLAMLNSKKILLVEDHPLNAQIAIRLLKKVDCIVTHTSNGQEGLDAFRNSSEFYYDAILMDLRMPVMDGLEATKAIRALEREDAAVVPIIAMTANAYEEDVQNCLKVGMNTHLAKPVEPAKMYKTILEQIAKK